jgi:hypothetical protein
MGGRSLRDAVEDWLALARELERLARARLLDESAAVAPEAALAARQRWIDVVQAVREAARGSKKTALLSVLARVSAIEQRAHRRAAQRRLAPAPSPSALSAASATTSTSTAGASFEDVGVDTLQLTSADIAAAQRLVERRRHRRPARGRG